jgi:hypothetical protein
MLVAAMAVLSTTPAGGHADVLIAVALGVDGNRRPRL